MEVKLWFVGCLPEAEALLPSRYTWKTKSRSIAKTTNNEFEFQVLGAGACDPKPITFYDAAHWRGGGYGGGHATGPQNTPTVRRQIREPSRHRTQNNLLRSRREQFVVLLYSNKCLLSFIIYCRADVYVHFARSWRCGCK